MSYIRRTYVSQTKSAACRLFKSLSILPLLAILYGNYVVPAQLVFFPYGVSITTLVNGILYIVCLLVMVHACYNVLSLCTVSS